MTSLFFAAAEEAAQPQGPEGHKDRDLVTVELNGTPQRIMAGKYSGRTLKLALDVPLEYELEQVVGGEFKPITDDTDIRIKGGEKFVSHIGQGQAS